MTTGKEWNESNEKNQKENGVATKMDIPRRGIRKLLSKKEIKTSENEVAQMKFGERTESVELKQKRS